MWKEHTFPSLYNFFKKLQKNVTKTWNNTHPYTFQAQNHRDLHYKDKIRIYC